MSASNEEKKIIIDEDWKSRVEAEKAAQAGTPAAEPAAAQAPSAKADKPPEPERPLPPADLIFLAGTLYMQSMLGLGLMPNPVSGKAEVSLPHAKHGIDSLDVLQAKTTGNRTPEESQVIESMLHELRMAYLAVAEKQP